MRYQAAIVLLGLSGVMGCTKTGLLTLEIERKGELGFTVENGATEYPITLESGQLLLEDINLIDESAPVPTQLLSAPTIFDFVASDIFTVGPVELPPKGFEQLHVFYEDAVDGPLASSMMVLSGQVTLSNAQTVNLSVTLSLPRTSQEMLAAVSIKPRTETTIKATFDATILLGKIDFDTLGAQGDITLAPNSGDPAIDAALETIAESLLRAFTFEGPAGGNING